jgi:hypothetical protein
MIASGGPKSREIAVARRGDRGIAGLPWRISTTSPVRPQVRVVDTEGGAISDLDVINRNLPGRRS